jgi:hypothetical protein
MLTRNQLTALFDYCKYFRFQAEKLTREAANSRSLDPELKAALVKEQTRRARELKRLETALGAEIDCFVEGSEIVCPEPIASPKHPATAPRAKRKSSATGKKSKRRAVGTTGTSSSGKNANDSTKRKPGRPRKIAPTE